MRQSFQPNLTLFPPEECQRVYDQACRVLESVGVLVENEDGRSLLESAGARTVAGRHRIPEPLVADALSSAPASFTVFDREGSPVMELGQGQPHFDPGSAAIHLLDSETGRRRPATSADVVNVVRLVDGLPHYAAQATALLPSDVPQEVADRYRLYLALRYGRKPIITGTFRKDAFAPMRAMLEAVRGGSEGLRARPLAIFDCCPSPPLKWSDLTCQSLIDCARSGIPAELVSMPLAGATAPVTLREAVVQHCAESLSGVVIHQLAGRGSPLIYGGAPAAFDMRRGTAPMGAIETMLIGIGYAQVGRHLGLPTHGYFALSDAKTPDYQAGLETGVGAVLAAAAGIDVVSGPGILDYILTQSLEKLLLDHEACGMALRLRRGISRHDDDPSELFEALVSKGEFLSHPHTRRHWRAEMVFPGPIIDREMYGDWESLGSRTALERARTEVVRLLAQGGTPEPFPHGDHQLVEVMTKELKRCGLDRPPA